MKLLAKNGIRFSTTFIADTSVASWHPVNFIDLAEAGVFQSRRILLYLFHFWSQSTLLYVEELVVVKHWM